MKTTIDELLDIVVSYAIKIKDIPEMEFSAKPLANKWSKKEVLGHLIDSAQNNMRRFIVAQYETTPPPKIIYDQDFWVRASNYQQMKKEDIVTLWTIVNQQLAGVLRNMPRAHFSHTADTGRLKTELHTLEWLAIDYVKHMKHHLNQIFPSSFDVVYK